MMKKYYVTACLLIKDENGYINEWLEWHLKIGVEHFYIYDNGSQTPISESVAPEFLPYCTFVDWAGPHVHTQLQAYEHFLKNYGHESFWTAFIDTDEFVRVIDGTDIREFMKAYENADALAIRWLTYNADGQLKRTNKPVRERFRQTVEYPPELPQQKCIVRPDRVPLMGPHKPSGYDPAYRTVTVVTEDHRPAGDRSFDYPHGKIVIDHYFTRSYEEWQEKMARGSCDPTYCRTDDWFQLLNPGLLEEV